MFLKEEAALLFFVLFPLDKKRKKFINLSHTNLFRCQRTNVIYA